MTAASPIGRMLGRGMRQECEKNKNKNTIRKRKSVINLVKPTLDLPSNRLREKCRGSWGKEREGGKTVNYVLYPSGSS